MDEERSLEWLYNLFKDKNLGGGRVTIFILVDF